MSMKWGDGCVLGLAIVTIVGCTKGSDDPFDGASDSDATAESSGQDSTANPSGETGTSSQGDSTDDGVIFDVGQDETTGVDPGPVCKVTDDMDAVIPCTESAPPDSFTPVVQWAWEGEADNQVLATPLVANLTDDNDDGEVDLCDTPDVVVAAYHSGGHSNSYAHLYVLDGETGAVHYQSEDFIHGIVYPAIGDIDGDGLPEIVTATYTQGYDGQLVAYEHDGTLAWTGNTTFKVSSGAVALADIDNDGDVEIVLRGHVADHDGNPLWQAPIGSAYINTIVDLDGDDDMEILIDGKAYHHDGTLYYDVPAIPYAHPQVADLDGDGLPEVLLIAIDGISILEHDGSVTVFNQSQWLGSYRPAAIHNMDDDPEPEIAVGSSNSYSVLEVDLTPKWTAQVLDNSGFAAGTAFDFLGDASAEAMYADETTMFIFGTGGGQLLTTGRESWTQWENPVVADVDNDGAAEIVVASNRGYTQELTSPPVQVIRDQGDEWVPARRIWNQHTYHVTNVREDGTIPQVEPRHWEHLNTFRTQAQSEGGLACQPEG